MSRIVVNKFEGEVPRLSKDLLPSNKAQIAKNCNLLTGALKAFKDLSVENSPAKTGFLKTIYLFGAGTGSPYWCDWNGDTDIARGPIAGDATERTYFTGTQSAGTPSTHIPRVFDNTLVNSGGGTGYPKSSYILGIPIPAAKPTLAKTGAPSGTPRTLAYVYTNVRKWASGKVDEGAPSPAETITNVSPGESVDVSGFSAIPSGDYNITHRRIYRASTGEYQYVKEITVGTSTTNDALADSALGEVIPSLEWDPPPTDMKGLIALPNGVMAGFSGNELCLSEPYQPHAWPLRYRQTMTFPIVAIGAYGTTIVVATTAYPFLVNGSDPETVSVAMIPDLQPCVSKRGLVSAESGVMYPAPGGIYFIGPSGRDLITRQTMTRDDWQALYPATMHARIYAGRYHAFYETGLVDGLMTGGGFILGAGDGGVQVTEMAGVGFYMHAAHVDPQSDVLYLAKDDNGTNRIMEWEGDDSNSLIYNWRSKEFLSQEIYNISVARVLAEYAPSLSAAEQAAYDASRQVFIDQNAALITSGANIGDALNTIEINAVAVDGSLLSTVPPAYVLPDSITFRFIVDGEEVFSDTIYSDEPFRLPLGRLGHRFEFEIDGKITVTEARIATSMGELAQ